MRDERKRMKAEGGTKNEKTPSRQWPMIPKVLDKAGLPGILDSASGMSRLASRLGAFSLEPSRFSVSRRPAAGVQRLPSPWRRCLRAAVRERALPAQRVGADRGRACADLRCCQTGVAARVTSCEWRVTSCGEGAISDCRLQIAECPDDADARRAQVKGQYDYAVNSS